MHLGDLRERAAAVEREAANHAASIVADAGSKRAGMLEGAKEQGYREGLAKGLAEGRAKGEADGHAAALAASRATLSEIEARWMTGAAEFEVARERMLGEARQDILRLAIQIAERVIKSRIETDPKIAVSQVESALGMIMRPSKLTIAINPEDETVLREAMPSMMARFSAAQHMELAMDPGLPRGSCVARTSGGEIDASIWTQLDRVSDTLLYGGMTRDTGRGKEPGVSEERGETGGES
jgi:flagellar assembly protein FliH